MMSLHTKERSKKPCTRTMPLKRQVFKKQKTSSLSRRILDKYRYRLYPKFSFSLCYDIDIERIVLR
jgi:hypothetical protein